MAYWMTILWYRCNVSLLLNQQQTYITSVSKNQSSNMPRLHHFTEVLFGQQVCFCKLGQHYDLCISVLSSCSWVHVSVSFCRRKSECEKCRLYRDFTFVFTSGTLTCYKLHWMSCILINVTLILHIKLLSARCICLRNKYFSTNAFFGWQF